LGELRITRFAEILISPSCIFIAICVTEPAVGVPQAMHILYVDDSGTVSDPDEHFFVLGAVSIFERGLFHQIKLTDDCVASFNLGDPHEIELHGSSMYHGRDGVWRSVRDRASREVMIHAALATLKGHASIRLFAVVIDKASVSPRDPVVMAFEEICNRFNLFLLRMNDRRTEEKQRGLIVMDESKHEKPLQTLARKFRIAGARWGHFRNLAEVPLFVDSRASRMIQMADLVAWSTFRRYQFKDGRFFDPITRVFDADGGVVHGLVHHKDRQEDCYCPACSSRGIRDAAVRAIMVRETYSLSRTEK
jgi:Protein of unknown function (DUF3800)